MKVWQLKTKKPENYSTVSVLQLLTTFGKPDLATLSLLNDQHPLYTRLVEDGNSFYRSVAITYILSFQDWSFQTLFPKISSLNLTQVNIKSIPEEFLTIYTNDQLQKLFEEGWRSFVEQSKSLESGSIEGLLRVLNERHLLEFILILYFRALVYKSVAEKTLTYSTLSNSKELTSSILTYSSHTFSDQEIKFMASSLQSQIYVVTLDNNYALTSQIYGATRNTQNILKRLPLLRIRDSFNPLYTASQVKQSKFVNQNKLGDKTLPRNHRNQMKSLADSSEIEDLQYPTFRDFNQSAESKPNKSNLFVSNPQKSSLRLDFSKEDLDSDSDQDQNPSTIPSKASHPAPFKSSQPLATSISQSSKYQLPNSSLSDPNPSFFKILRLLIIVSLIIITAWLIFGGRIYKPQKMQYPAREVHFIKDQNGNYHIEQ